jgi:lysophospholipase L1-like esterase
VSPTRAERLPSEIRGHPQKVFVQSGVNDILRTIPTDKIIAGYKTIIAMIQSQSPNTKIFINGIFPLRKGDDTKIKQVNAKLEALCKVNSIVFIDNYTDMVDDNALKSGYHTGDSLHLNYDG